MRGIHCIFHRHCNDDVHDDGDDAAVAAADDDDDNDDDGGGNDDDINININYALPI